MMKKRIAILLSVLLPVFAMAALDEMSFARRVVCEVQEPDGDSLERVTFQQGTTPLLDLYVLRRGRPIATDTTVTARLVFGPLSTGSYFAAVTNYAVTNNSYLVQCPTIGTNSAGATNGLWWFTVYFDRAGRTFWTGNGELVIEKTSSTADDGLNWQPITAAAALTAHNTNGAAHADIRALIPTLPGSYTDAVARAGVVSNYNQLGVIGGIASNAQSSADSNTSTLIVYDARITSNAQAAAFVSNGVVVLNSQTSKYENAAAQAFYASNGVVTAAGALIAHNINTTTGHGGILGAAVTSVVVNGVTGTVAGHVFSVTIPVGGAETDPVFTNWLSTGTVTAVESDPVFTNWLATGTVSTVESDPVFTNWAATSTVVMAESDPAWAAASNAVTIGATAGATALQPAATNGWIVTAHLDWIERFETNGWDVSSHSLLVAKTDTNGWTVTAHEAWLTYEQDTNALTQAHLANWTPFVIAPATNVTLDATNNLQFLGVTDPTCTINAPAVVTNKTQTIRLDLMAGTNAITFEASISNAASVIISTDGVTPLIFDKAFMSTFWKVINL